MPEIDYLITDPPAESSDPQGGNESCVFTNLAKLEPANTTGQVGESTNMELTVVTPDENLNLKLPAHPSISCRITPSGESFFNLYWP